MPKLKDQFEQDLYQAFDQCGFDVHIATEVSEVEGAELKLGKNKALRFVGEDDQPSSSEVVFLAMVGDPYQSEGGKDLKSTSLVIDRADSKSIMVTKILLVVQKLVPETVGIKDNTAPETVRDVPTIDKKELEKKRDTLLDKLNSLPEGDPKREQVKEQLKSLKAGLHRVSFDIEVPEDSVLSVEQYIEVLKQAHIQLSGSLVQSNIEINHTRDLLAQLHVGERVLIASNIDLVDTVYFSDGFHCGYHIPVEAVDLGKYKIVVKQGTYATVNSVRGSKVDLIEVSELGVISAYDHIKDREISNQVQVHSCTIDLQHLKKVSTQCSHAWTPTSYEALKEKNAKQHCLLCNRTRTWTGGYGEKQEGGRWVEDENSGTQVEAQVSVERCNCENSGCLEHEGAACTQEADGNNKAIYIGPICSDCAKRMPEKYMTTIDGKSTGRD